MVKCNHFSWRRAMSQHKFLRCVSFLTDRGVGQRWCILLLFGLLFIPSVAFAADLGLDDIIQNIQSNQSKVKDMYAETTTTITSSIAMPGSESKGPQKMVQKGKIWTKGESKSKIEMLSPTRQVTITNGDQRP